MRHMVAAQETQKLTKDRLIAERRHILHRDKSRLALLDQFPKTA